MASVGHDRQRQTGLIGALRHLRDPLLLLAVPITFATLQVVVGYPAGWPIGFDFRGTLWEPARAVLEGGAIYPEPTRDSVLVGNPAVYPPVFILAAVPLAFLPVGLASSLWFLILGMCVLAAMWIVGLRDWRCHVLAVTSPVVVHGLFFGNLTIVLVLLVALAWRYRDNARIVGIAVGVAVAAKLFVAPLVLWLVFTRRFRAAAWSVATAVVLVLGAWALIGFEGLRDYPRLLAEVQEVYAIRSVSLSTVAGALGAPVSVAVGFAALAGLAAVGVAAYFARRPGGDTIAFTLTILGSVIASPIVWPNYAALLLVPLAVVVTRFAPVWLFGYAVWLVGALSPKPPDPIVCCRPPGVPEQAWLWSHAEPSLWYAASVLTVVIATAVWIAVSARKKPLSVNASVVST